MFPELEIEYNLEPLFAVCAVYTMEVEVPEAGKAWTENQAFDFTHCPDTELRLTSLEIKSSRF